MAATERARLAAALGAACLLVPQAAAADSRAAMKLGVYSDDDHTLVITPMVAAAAEVSPRTTVTASYVADMVTSASADLVSAATEEYAERRDVVGAGFDYRTKDSLSAGLGYEISNETDYRSHTFAAHLGKELAGRNTTLTGTLALSLNDVGRSGDERFSESMTNRSLLLSLVQVLGRGSIARLTYQGQWSTGYHASVYRYAGVYSGDTLVLQGPEVLPDQRVRHAVVAAWKQHLGGPLFGHADYRFYTDDWGLVGHTVSAAAAWQVTDGLTVQARERVARQGAASFYRGRYTEVQRYMTSDKELGGLWSSLTALRVDQVWDNPGLRAVGIASFGLDAEGSRLLIRYDDSERLSRLVGWVGEIGTFATF